MHHIPVTRTGWRARAALLSMALVFLLSRAQPRAHADEDALGVQCASPKACVDDAARAYLQQGPASALQIAIWRDGDFVYSEAFGFTDPQRRRPASRRSLFQVGSNTKKATALAVMRAVDEGRIRLDDPVARALPLFRLARAPAWSREATVRDLLSHRSGLWDYTPGYEAPEDWRLQHTVWGVFAAKEWAPTPVAAAHNYANPNYALLAAILERAYGRAYAEIMEREVYRPLRMRDTYARRDDALETGRAVWSFGAKGAPAAADDDFDPAALIAVPPPWLAPPSWVSPAEQADNAFLRPAGLSWSTAEDECMIGAMLVGGAPSFLSEASRAALVNPQTPVTPGDPNLSYAFGLYVSPRLVLAPDEQYDLQSWTHSGGTLSMASFFLVIPERRLVISVLRNTRDQTGHLRGIMSAALSGYAQLPERHAAPPVPPDEGARYAGSYRDPDGLGTLVLQWDGSSLRVSAPELEARGIAVGPSVTIIRPNVLLIPILGRPLQFTVWPSELSDAGYLVGREDSFTRVSP
jgi:CubicO group peptidase (beta-lactamase class C family)